MSFLSFFGGQDSGVKNLNSNEFSESLKSNPDAVLIDVRTDMEYNMGHIPGAVLMDITDPQFMDRIESLDKNKHYYVYCRSGSRSMNAARMMIKKGFVNTYNLSRGVIGWREELVTK